MGRLHVDANAREEEKRAHFRFFARPKMLLALQACLYEAVASASAYLPLSHDRLSRTPYILRDW